MRGRDFLRTAAHLSGVEDEASYRTRIGRHSHAACLEARAWCQAHAGYVHSRSAREHAEVVRLLAQQDSTLADRLTFLRLLRNPADYDLTLAAETVRLQLASARVTSRHIVAGLDALRPPAAG